MSTAFYINPLGDNIVISVIDTNKHHVIASHSLEIGNNNLDSIPIFFTKLKHKYFPKEIWCITGPGPFTLMRIITLTINGLAFLQRIKIKGAHFFDMINTLYPDKMPIIEANEREYLIRQTKEHKDEIREKNNIPNGEYIGKIKGNHTLNYKEWKDDIESIIQYFTNKDDILRLSPEYIKPPKITLPKTQHPLNNTALQI